MLNKVQLIGFTGAEPEIRTTSGGKKLALLRVATSRYTRREGERQHYTTWHTVEVWSPGTVRWLETKGLATGSKVFVDGEIRHDRFTDKDGVERFFSKVVIAYPGHEVRSLDRPSDNAAEDED